MEVGLGAGGDGEDQELWGFVGVEAEDSLSRDFRRRVVVLIRRRCSRVVSIFPFQR